MKEQIELNLACYKLMQAIKNGNRINADYDQKWEAYKIKSQKLKNLRKA